MEYLKYFRFDPSLVSAIRDCNHLSELVDGERGDCLLSHGD